ncbi:hypothetical protein [Peribacillus kribbensis]|uniref:hypothetical protein n=1 Tax=Peribacillus kribbensis TaxID=356658 RepID=UPI000427855B
MEQLPCTGCRGLCCGPVAITESELKKIKKKVKNMPQKSRHSLEAQRRFPGTCIFYDQGKGPMWNLQRPSTGMQHVWLL